MRDFLFKLFAFAIFPIASLYGVFLLENGTADPFYQRFVTPKQEALILGNSKAAQGIIPSILNEDLKGLYEGQLYNYSFTVYNSPFGPTYLNSLKNKLSESKRRKCFIITVDPWSISSDKVNPNDLEKFKENDEFLSEVNNVSMRPNLAYMLNWFSKSFYEILLKRFIPGLSKLHFDGWYETTADLIGTSEEERREFMIEFYKGYLGKNSFSEQRYKFLIDTIEFLESKGDVYLVRMPLHDEILEIEDQVDINFDLRMDALSKSYGVPFFDFSKMEYEFEFKDGLHLNKESAQKFSMILAALISQSKQG